VDRIEVFNDFRSSIFYPQSSAIEEEYLVIQAYVLIEAEPTRVQDLMQELPNMELDGSVIKQVHAVTGRYDLIAFVESPDLQSLGN
jgi:hypothetical protein